MGITLNSSRSRCYNYNSYFNNNSNITLLRAVFQGLSQAPYTYYRIQSSPLPFQLGTKMLMPTLPGIGSGKLGFELWSM